MVTCDRGELALRHSSWELILVIIGAVAICVAGAVAGALVIAGFFLRGTRKEGDVMPASGPVPEAPQASSGRPVSEAPAERVAESAQTPAHEAVVSAVQPEAVAPLASEEESASPEARHGCGAGEGEGGALAHELATALLEAHQAVSEEHVRGQLLTAMRRLGLELVLPDEMSPFDPAVHDAVRQVPTVVAERNGLIAWPQRPGLRHARCGQVIVAVQVNRYDYVWA